MLKDTILNSSKYRWKVLWASVAGYAMDGLDMLILSFALPFIMKEFGLNAAQGGFISTITLIGAVLGGYLFGILADYIGRVKVFSYTIIIFSVATGLTAFVHSYLWLNLWRFLAGLGLGGEFGIGMTLVTETWPKEKRARATGGVAIGWQLGAVLAALISSYLLPIYGWRSLFIVGVLPAIFAAWSRFGVQEPAMWLEEKRMHEQLKDKIQKGKSLNEKEQTQLNNDKFPLLHLFKDSETSRNTYVLTVMTSVQNFGYYGIMTWLPTILMKKTGLNLTKTSQWMVATILGMIIGILVFGYIADRIGRRSAYLTFQIAAAVSVWIYSGLTNPTSILIGGAILGFFANGMMAGYGALLAENYSTSARSTAENFIFNTGRAVGGFAPFVIGLLSTRYSLSGALLILALVYIFAAINVFFLLPETKDKDLA